jgi:Putative prokaryotic signal transducing protein
MTTEPTFTSLIPSGGDEPMPSKPTLYDFEMILEINNAGDQAFLRSILDAEGIDYFIQGATVAPYIFHAVPMRLMVRKDQADGARELLANFAQSHAYGGLKKMLD